MTSRSDPASMAKKHLPLRTKPGDAAPAPAGYSGTPLVKKLGIKEGHRVVVLNDAAGAIRRAIGGVPPETRMGTFLSRSPVDVIILAAKNLSVCTTGVEKASPLLKPDACLWVCWYKKSSGISTDLTEDAVRAIGLAAGLVDIKVCAVTDAWSGLKFVVPVKDRAAWGKRTS